MAEEQLKIRPKESIKNLGKKKLELPLIQSKFINGFDNYTELTHCNLALEYQAELVRKLLVQKEITIHSVECIYRAGEFNLFCESRRPLGAIELTRASSDTRAINSNRERRARRYGKLRLMRNLAAPPVVCEHS